MVTGVICPSFDSLSFRFIEWVPGYCPSPSHPNFTRYPELTTRYERGDVLEITDSRRGTRNQVHSEGGWKAPFIVVVSLDYNPSKGA